MAYTAKTRPHNPSGPSPLRRPGSIRRTSSLDTDWPDGIGTPSRVVGRARDLYTAPDGSSRILAEDRYDITATPMREITSIHTSRLNDVAQQFVGARGGGHLRGEIQRILPEEQANASTLNLILDDFSGASLVAGWAWSRWKPNWMEETRRQAAVVGAEAPGPRRMEGICSGFRPGASSLNPDGTSRQDTQGQTEVAPLPHPDDPLGWHELPLQDSAGMRRARRTDVWFDGDFVKMDIGFQDSANSPTGGDRICIHEYRVTARCDPDTFELLAIEADPRVLPYRECPGAAPNAALMLGLNLPDFRLKVPERLPGTMGCTHLNDVLRQMTDVPVLVRELRAALGR